PPPQQAKHDCLNLVIAVVRRHEVARAVTPLRIAQPCVPRLPGAGLRRVWTKVELAQFEGQAVLLRQVADGLSDRPTVRGNSMVRMRHHECPPHSEASPTSTAKAAAKSAPPETPTTDRAGADNNRPPPTAPHRGQKRECDARG